MVTTEGKFPPGCHSYDAVNCEGSIIGIPDPETCSLTRWDQIQLPN